MCERHTFVGANPTLFNHAADVALVSNTHVKRRLDYPILDDNLWKRGSYCNKRKSIAELNPRANIVQRKTNIEANRQTINHENVIMPYAIEL
ncbi:CLUMA_CG009811, isoform A [Clunio marinus]|uniref:CLUMA_CG009811, isoform A n=1 Tax=Clunio marinus TaxID=568069 RepID=A0A1J1I9I6_9DIPT|nr:CLUMA_CG009811, isoform A [Clunio marinus]